MENVANVRILLGNILTNGDMLSEPGGDIVRLIAHQAADNSLQITPIQSYSSKVFLLSVGSDTREFILKVRPVDSLLKLGMEVKAFRIISTAVDVPNLIFYGISCGYEVVIYHHLSGGDSIENVLSEDKITAIWKLILIIQKALCSSLELLNLNRAHITKYSSEIQRYTQKYVSKDISLLSLQTLDDRMHRPQFTDSMTVFSDRGPVNWVIGDSIVAIDFDLLLLEPCLADFIQFIDHHDLHTLYSRDELIDKCLLFLCENNINFTLEDFHWHALYRNLTQGAIFYKVSRRISLLHYEKALLSSRVLNETLLEKEIKKILTEVAWI